MIRRLRWCALLVLAASPLAAQAPPRTLSLEEALRLATPASEVLGLARSAVVRARGQQYQARSELFPQISGSASYSRLIKSQFSSLRTTDTTTNTAPTHCDKFVSDPTQPIGARVDSLEKSVECFTALNPFGSLGSLPFGRETPTTSACRCRRPSSAVDGCPARSRPRAPAAGARTSAWMRAKPS